MFSFLTDAPRVISLYYYWKTSEARIPHKFHFSSNLHHRGEAKLRSYDAPRRKSCREGEEEKNSIFVRKSTRKRDAITHHRASRTVEATVDPLSLMASIIGVSNPGRGAAPLLILSTAAEFMIFSLHSSPIFLLITILSKYS
jgi:hypothetical protein